MLNNSSSELDLESQERLPPLTTKFPRDPWRWIFLILHVHQVFISVVSNAKKGSHALLRVSRSICVSSSSDTRDGALEQTEVPTTALPEVSLNVDASDAELQYENIAEIVRKKDSNSLYEFGGVHACAEAFDTDLENGISGSKEDLQCRRMIFQPPAQGSVKFLFKGCNTLIFFLLFLSGVLSLIFGIMKEGWRTGWYEGAIILVAVIILVAAPSIRDFWLESSQKSSKQKLMEKREMVVHAIRDGRQHPISFSEVLLGDIVDLKRGHQVPADGLFVSGEFSTLDDGLQTIVNDQNPFLFYGTKVINGTGRMLVTAVGVNTAWGEMMSRVTPLKKTPLQSQVDKVNTRIQIIGLIMSILILVDFILRFELAKEEKKSGFPDFKGKPIPIEKLADAIKRVCMKTNGKISILTTLLTVLLVGIVEGFPFVVTVAITYWNKKTLSGKAFAKKSLACVSMGSVTKIVTDKTGGLTLNPEEVDMCRIGEEIISEDSVVAPHVLEALCDGISAPVLVLQNHDTSEEDPLLSWAAWKLGIQMDIMKQSCSIVKAKELAPNEEAYGVLVRKNRENGTLFSHWKGPATTILAKCSYYYDSEGRTEVMDGQKKSEFEQTIEDMQSKQLETVAFAYKETEVPVLEDENLIFLGLFGLKKTCWEKTIEEIKICRNAGVSIILVSRDDVSELKKIAIKCGLLSSDSDAMIKKGEEFQNCTHEERMKMVDEISVMGNSLPADRFLLVQCLKKKGHTVAVAGVTTNEIPALKEADVGLAMGTWSSNMARESSDIIIWEDSFSFLVTILRSGRCTYENIQKYIQFELTMFAAGLLINCITTVSSGDSPITAIQLIWVNLVVAIFGGLALLTQPPTEKLMKKPAVGRNQPFFTKTMWRNIISQTLYQAAIITTFHFKGKAILHINDKVSKSIAFNSFLLCQVFNQFNARELEKKNVFRGIHQNKWFWLASVIVTVVSQEAFLEIAHFVVHNAELNYKHWAVCVLIGMPSWVIDWVTKWTWGFIMNCLTTEPLSSHSGSISTTSCAPLEPTSSLELTHISDNSIAVPS